MTDPITPQLTANWDQPRAWKLHNYERVGGYEALRAAITADPAAVVTAVKDSGLRGRGGAGFPTGVKWRLLDPDLSKPRYLVVNADESEPGACKDMPLMMASPHTLVEGIALTCYGIGAHHGFIYVRGEVLHVVRRLRQAVAEAYSAGYLGRNILGSGFDLDVIVHAGAGAYICGEETALLDSLEGRRGQPRLRPPFPAAAGVYGSPTVINNVETIATVPAIVRNGPEWFRAMGTENSTGSGIFSVSGHVTNPGQIEVPLGTSLRTLLDLVGGIRGGHRLKFWTPGGSSSPIFTEEHLDLPLDYDSVIKAGSMLGTRSIQVFDETTSVVRAVLRWSEFYKHESCGKCTPCREGTWWLVQILQRIEAGQGQEGDIEKLLDICDNIGGKAFCGLGDGAISCVNSAIKTSERNSKPATTPQPGNSCHTRPACSTTPPPCLLSKGQTSNRRHRRGRRAGPPGRNARWLPGQRTFPRDQRAPDAIRCVPVTGSACDTRVDLWGLSSTVAGRATSACATVSSSPVGSVHRGFDDEESTRMAVPQTFGEFQDYVKNLEQERGFAGDSILQKCLLLGEEVGELFKSVRKTSGVGVDVAAQTDENPAHEMADILIILATIANRLDIDLGEAIRSKEEINARRAWG